MVTVYYYMWAIVFVVGIVAGLPIAFIPAMPVCAPWCRACLRIKTGR